jgi:ribonuclease HI
MSKKKEAVVAFESRKGLTLYTDAGTRPNPGFGGCGIHGYHYNTQPATKGIGLGSIVASTAGYYDKNASLSKPGSGIDGTGESLESRSLLITPTSSLDFHEHFLQGVPCAVTVTDFVDGSTTMDGIVTNNESEVSAVLHAMEYALEHKPDYLHIITDSRYALNGTTKWMHNWNRNHWRRDDGSDIGNLSTWIKVYETWNKLFDSGVHVNMSWIRGHSGETGNERADVQASVGVFQASKGKPSKQFTTVEANGYWNADDARHPFINHRFCYFNTRPDATTPGVYYQGNKGKDEELVGNRSGDAAYSVIRLETPDPLIEVIRKSQAHYSQNADSLFMAHLGNIFTPMVRWLLNQYGEDAFIPPSGYRTDLVLVDEPSTLVSREFKPPRIAMRSVEELEKLARRLDQWEDGSTELHATDLTELFYDITQVLPKKVKKDDPAPVPEQKFTLKSEFTVGTSSQRAKVRHPFQKGEDDLLEVTLTMGIDILDRNSLKRLEDLKPRVYVISWAESEQVFRYATVIQAGNSKGIWAGVYSNLRILP